jgi:hypothetical protein
VTDRVGIDPPAPRGLQQPAAQRENARVGRLECLYMEVQVELRIPVLPAAASLPALLRPFRRRPLQPDPAVDALPQQVGVANVTGIFLDHVHEHLEQ